MSELEETGLNRQNFIKMTGMVAAGTALGLSFPEASLEKPKFNPKNGTGYWNWVKNQFIIDPKVTYMNIGTTGLMLAISDIWLCLFFHNALTCEKMPILGQSPSTHPKNVLFWSLRLPVANQDPRQF